MRNIDKIIADTFPELKTPTNSQFQEPQKFPSKKIQNKSKT